MQPASSTPQPQLRVPPGWMIVKDPVSGQNYYANPTTGMTSWTPPPQVIPPPPPPPPPASRPVQTTPVSHSHDTASIIISNSAGGTGTGNNTCNVGSIMKTVPMTIGASGLLIPKARFIINSAKSNNNNNSNSNSNSGDERHPVELYFTAGMLADIANAQANQDEMERMHVHSIKKSHPNPYEPLLPFDDERLPITTTAPHTEGGRVDIRLMTLMDTLAKI